jgi:hypothetical protein
MSARYSLAVVIPLLVAAAAYACSCAPPPSPKKSLEKAAAVFSGKVLKIEKDGEFELAVTFAVDQVWKGKEAKELVVRTGTNDGICGYKFKKGASYLIYAHESTRDEMKYLVTNICTRTAALADAQEDLKELGEGKKL